LPLLVGRPKLYVHVNDCKLYHFTIVGLQYLNYIHISNHHSYHVRQSHQMILKIPLTFIIFHRSFHR
jgi:hypothetical protein